MVKQKELSESLDWMENELLDRERKTNNLLREMDGQCKGFKDKLQ